MTIQKVVQILPYLNISSGYTIERLLLWLTIFFRVASNSMLTENLQVFILAILVPDDGKIVESARVLGLVVNR